jgi:hypothetical protein
MLPPAGTPAASQHPQQLVPGAKPKARSCSSRTGQDRELVPQEQVLEHEILARANGRQDHREQHREPFKHTSSIADLWPREDLPSVS